MVEHTCAGGDPACDGIEGLFFGELSCFDCWQIAPELALEIQMGAL